SDTHRARRLAAGGCVAGTGPSAPIPPRAPTPAPTLRCRTASGHAGNDAGHTMWHPSAHLGHAIAHAPYRLDRAGRQLLAQPASEDVDRVGVSVGILCVDVFGQVVA